MSAPAVATHAITKRYGEVLAVDRLDLRVEPGDIYAFLGLNGAGKSTTIRMLLGMIRPSSGHAEIFGERVRADTPALWRRVGHLVEFATAYPELTVRENLEVASRLQQLREPGAVERVIEQLGLAPYAERRARALSLGNLQRLALARALLHRPRLLVLDEPANGLDPAGVIEIRELLRTLARQEGVTVFMSSHVLGEVARLASRIGIVHHGRLIEELGADELEQRLDRRLEIGVRDPVAAEAALREGGFAPVRSEGPRGELLLLLREARALEAPEEVATQLCSAGAPPTRLAAVQADLESHFIDLTRQADARLDRDAS